MMNKEFTNDLETNFFTQPVFYTSIDANSLNS